MSEVLTCIILSAVMLRFSLLCRPPAIFFPRAQRYGRACAMRVRSATIFQRLCALARAIFRVWRRR